jgi:hypothetical protein
MERASRRLKILTMTMRIIGTDLSVKVRKNKAEAPQNRLHADSHAMPGGIGRVGHERGAKNRYLVMTYSPVLCY